jgi:hypothetical protein
MQNIEAASFVASNALRNVSIFFTATLQKMKALRNEKNETENQFKNWSA